MSTWQDNASTLSGNSKEDQILLGQPGIYGPDERATDQHAWSPARRIFPPSGCVVYHITAASRPSLPCLFRKVLRPKGPESPAFDLRRSLTLSGQEEGRQVNHFGGLAFGHLREEFAI